jgi:hypothetical protein
MAPFVLGATKPAHAEDDDLPLSRRKCRFGEHVASEHEPTLQKLRMARESGENVEHAAISLERLQNFFDLVVPLGLRQERNTCLLQSHALISFSVRDTGGVYIFIA